MNVDEECINIDSSDEEDVQIVESSYPRTKQEPLDDDLKSKKIIPLITIDTGKSIFSKFLQECKKTDPSTDMDVVVNKMWRRFHQAEVDFTSSLYFMEFLKKSEDRVTSEPYTQLKAVSDELQLHTVKIKKRPVDTNLVQTSEKTEIDPKTQSHIRKLEKLVEKLQGKIKHLEEIEIDLMNSSDDEDSAYIQVCRYKKRICDVFRKICELKKTSLPEDSLGNIKFSGTKVTAINRAIEKFYNDRREFPDYRDVLVIVEKANEIKKLNMSPEECQRLAVHAFKELGETLKKYREYDFNNCLTSYLGEQLCDPAAENPGLAEKLDENKKKYGNRIDEVIDKYALKQMEENLKPEEVASDAMSESDDDDDEDDAVTSVEESEPIDSVNDDEVDSEVDNEEPPTKVIDVKVLVPNIQQMPEWQKYKSCINFTKAASTTASACTKICEPVPGCSKNIVDDFCLSCSDKELNRSIQKRKRTELSNYSDEHDDYTEEWKSDNVQSMSICTAEPRPKCSKSVDATSLCNNMTTPYVFVDTTTVHSADANDTKTKQSSSHNNNKHVGSYEATCVQILKPKTENSRSVVTDTISIANHSKPAGNQNEIRIINVRSEGRDCLESLRVENNNDVSVPVSVLRTDVQNGEKSKIAEVNNGDGIIDLEKMPDLKSVCKTTDSKLIEENGPKNSIDSSSSFPRTNQSKDDLHSRPPWLKNSPWKPKILATSTPTPHTSQLRTISRYQVPQFRRVLDHRSSNNSDTPRNIPQARYSTSQSQLQQHQQRHPRSPFISHRNIQVAPRATVARQQTMHSTQKFIKGNNLYMQTTTVVQQQSVMQLPSNNVAGNHQRFSRISDVANARCFSQGSRYGMHKRPQQRDERSKEKRSSSTDVITLD